MKAHTRSYKEFETGLLANCPHVFHGVSPGFEIGRGWYHIIEALCRQINSYIDHKKKSYDSRPTSLEPRIEVPDVTVDQVKEKFGGLRFYYQGGDQYIDGLVQMAESWASHTCEVCGHPGMLKKRSTGWLSTVCEEHSNDRAA